MAAVPADGFAGSSKAAAAAAADVGNVSSEAATAAASAGYSGSAGSEGSDNSLPGAAAAPLFNGTIVAGRAAATTAVEMDQLTSVTRYMSYHDR